MLPMLTRIDGMTYINSPSSCVIFIVQVYGVNRPPRSLMPLLICQTHCLSNSHPVGADIVAPLLAPLKIIQHTTETASSRLHSGEELASECPDVEN